MTNDERDQLILETHDAIILLVPTVENLSTTVWGNGKPGLKEDVAILKTHHEECRRQESKRGGEVANYIALAALLVAIIAQLSLM
jgi:hypothetical protein